MPDLNLRVAKLERRCRVLMVLVLAGVGLAVTMGAYSRFASYDDVETKRLRIVDDGGKTRIALGTVGELAVVSLYRPDGEAVGLTMYCTAEGAQIDLHRDATKGLTLAANSKAAALRVCDTKGTTRVLAGAIDDVATVFVYDKEGNAIEAIGLE